MVLQINDAGAWAFDSETRYDFYKFWSVGRSPNISLDFIYGNLHIYHFYSLSIKYMYL